MSKYNLLYRGSLTSCNYSCSYCPFAKTSNTRKERDTDQRQFEQFIAWIANTPEHQFKILITPWGEAIVRGYYRRGLITLSHLPNVERIAMQTNLACNLSEFDKANKDALAFWATYHPTQTSRSQFIQRCAQLDQLDIRYSVGVVGMKDHFDEIEGLRQELHSNVYLWINAYKRDPDYYDKHQIEFLRTIDPYFNLNMHRYPSLDKPCKAGDTAFTVDGDGNVRRCHFIKQLLGNIYTDDIFTQLNPSNCTANTCGCHIGYVYRPELNLDSLYGDNLMERIPEKWPTIQNI